MLYADWEAEGERRFGADRLNWKFVCPVCKHVQSVADYKAAGAPVDSAAFSCVGRWMENSRRAFEERGSGPCNYAGGGLFRLNPVPVEMPGGKTINVFAFAPAESKEPDGESAHAG